MFEKNNLLFLTFFSAPLNVSCVFNVGAQTRQIMKLFRKQAEGNMDKGIIHVSDVFYHDSCRYISGRSSNLVGTKSNVAGAKLNVIGPESNSVGINQMW